MQIEYGKGIVDIPIDEKRVLSVLQPKEVKGVERIEEKVKESLEKPIGSPPLSEILIGKKKAIILTVNFTRPSPQALIHPIIEVCEKNKLEVTILIAKGRHRSMTQEEIRNHLGDELVNRYPILEHDPFDESIHREVGKTSREVPIRVNKAIFENDLVIGTGMIEPSYLCGFSGGRKLLMPGISHFRSIDLNHYLLLEKGASPGILDGNPLSEDSEEAARKLPFHWITYSVVGADDQVADVISGDPFQAHRFACEKSKEIYKCKRKLADIVLSSPGGYPYDCDLVQGKKAIIPAMEAVRSKGAIILFAECQEGWGAEPTFREWLTGFSPEEVMVKVKDKELFSLGAHGAYLFAKPLIEKGIKVILVTNPGMAKDLKGTYVEAVSSFGQAMEIAEQHTCLKAEITVLRKARRLIIV
jgi:nickel-dependent lactate racemase